MERTGVRPTAASGDGVNQMPLTDRERSWRLVSAMSARCILPRFCWSCSISRQEAQQSSAHEIKLFWKGRDFVMLRAIRLACRSDNSPQLVRKQLFGAANGIGAPAGRDYLPHVACSARWGKSHGRSAPGHVAVDGFAERSMQLWTVARSGRYAGRAVGWWGCGRHPAVPFALATRLFTWGNVANFSWCRHFSWRSNNMNL